MIQINFEPNRYEECTYLSLCSGPYLPIQILYEMMVSINPEFGIQINQEVIIKNDKIITCYYHEVGVQTDKYIHITRDCGKTINIKKDG